MFLFQSYTILINTIKAYGTQYDFFMRKHAIVKYAVPYIDFNICKNVICTMIILFTAAILVIVVNNQITR
jgi:hypothetical protein